MTYIFVIFICYYYFVILFCLTGKLLPLPVPQDSKTNAGVLSLQLAFIGGKNVQFNRDLLCY